MTFREAIKEIESHDFAVQLNLASDLNMFMTILREQKSTQVILEYLYSDENIRNLVRHCLRLSIREVDIRYENPWDIAMSTCLWLIGQKNLELAGFVASNVIKSRNTWWSRKLSVEILLKGIIKTVSGREKTEIVSSNLFGFYLDQKSDSLEVILSPGFLVWGDLDKTSFPLYDTKLDLTSDKFPSIAYNWYRSDLGQIDYNINTSNQL